MACKAAAVAVSRRLSGKTSYQAAYSACRASSPATASSQRCGAGAPVGWPSDSGPQALVVGPRVARAIAGLAFGVAERVSHLRVGGLLAWLVLRYCNAIQWDGWKRPGAHPGRRGAIALGWRIDGVTLAQAGSLQLDAVGAVNDAVQDRVADRRIADEFVPARHGDLAGHQQRSLLVAVIDDLQQVAALLGGQRLRAPSRR